MGRKCSTPGCTTRLNSFNPGPECYAHQPREFGFQVMASDFVKPKLCPSCDRFHYGKRPRCVDCRFWFAFSVNNHGARGYADGCRCGVCMASHRVKVDSGHALHSRYRTWRATTRQEPASV